MNKSNRGWNDTGRAKSAAEIDIRCATGLLESDSGEWPAYGIVSSPSAFAAAEPYLGRRPEGVAYAEWLDKPHLQELSRKLSDDIELLIGLGGGTALDASKFVALEKDLPLILVPSIVSTGAIIHSFFANWAGRKTLGDPKQWPWVDCEYVLVDCDYVLTAPAYLNTAGIGDILCIYAGIPEWRWRAAHGIGPAFDKGWAADINTYFEDLVNGFRATLDTNGAMTAESVCFIARAMQERDARMAAAQASGGSGDHPLWHAFENANDDAWVHGEIVAMGSVIIAWHAGETPERLTDWLRQCSVRFAPTEIGISREEFDRGMEHVPDYMAQAGIDSILRYEPITGGRVDELWDFLHQEEI